jgi:5,5'-dehydrodivanillate O-demethylase oxygenase subunit
MDDRTRPKDELSLLTESARGTPMGTLLRRFWQPIAVADRVATGTALGLTALGEELTLYRGDSGALHLVGGRCAHRCTLLHMGWVEGEELRCMYHGWRYDSAGQCTDMPAEKRARPEIVRIASYPVREYAGLVFAYMGEAPAPDFELPRKDALEDDTRRIFVQQQVWDCNWFQQVENSLDAAHVSFVHVWGRMSRFGEEISTAIPDLAYEETGAGMRQTATRSKTNVRISDWTFPNNNHIVSPGTRKGDPWIDTVVWAVPVDDEHTLRFTLYAVPRSDFEAERRFEADWGQVYNPADHRDAIFSQHRLPETSPSQLITTQDYVAVRGQGAIFDRSKEYLGASDAGIVMLRRIFLRELAAIRAGRPTKDWAKLAEAAHLPIQIAEPAAE